MGNKDEKEIVDKKRRKTSLSASDVTIKTKEDIYTVSTKSISNLSRNTINSKLISPVHNRL